MTTPTPLLRMLRALSPEQRSALADACGTTVVYLYQLATQPHPNPRLRLAQALVHEAKDLRRHYVTRHRGERGDLPNLHADRRTTSRVYDATRIERRKAL